MRVKILSLCFATLKYSKFSFFFAFKMPLNLVQNVTCDKKLSFINFFGINFTVLKETSSTRHLRSLMDFNFLTCLLFSEEVSKIKIFFFTYVQDGGKKGFEKLSRREKGKLFFFLRLIKHYVKLDFYHAKLNLAIYTTTLSSLKYVLS
jgi:hypothetical protein